MFWCFLIVPTGSPLKFTASGLSSRSANFSWEPPLVHLQNGIIVIYYINVTVAETEQMLEFSSNMTSLSVATLMPHRTYLCKIAAATSIGVGPYSSLITLYTPQDGRPKSAVTNSMSCVFLTNILFSSDFGSCGSIFDGQGLSYSELYLVRSS